MALIFDGFPSSESAHAFARFAGATFGRATDVFSSVDAANLHDPFPFELVPPVVHVERTDDEDEEPIELSVVAYGGRFAGT